MQSRGILKDNFEINEFPFILDPSNSLSHEQQYNNLLGIMAVPTLGIYNNSEYEMYYPHFMINLPCQIIDSKCYYKGQQINLPKQVIKQLKIQDGKIPHNRGAGQRNNNNNNFNSHQSFQPYQPKNTFTLRFILTTKTFESGQYPLNYVCHNYIFNNKNFNFESRHRQNVPICLIPCLESGVSEWNEDLTKLNFNKLRSQYISFHLSHGAPSFSPNNMKLRLNKLTKHVNFYTVLLTKSQYSDTKTILDIIKMSECIRDIVVYYRDFIGADEALKQFAKIFNINF